MITVQIRYLFYKVKLKLSSLLERLWLPKLDRCKFWERSPGNTPPQELFMSSWWGHRTFEKYLLICTSECISICQVTWQSSDNGKECHLLFCSSEVYLLSNFVDQLKPLQNEDTSTLLYKTYISTWHCIFTFSRFAVSVSCLSVNKKST